MKNDWNWKIFTFLFEYCQMNFFSELTRIKYKRSWYSSLKEMDLIQCFLRLMIVDNWIFFSIQQVSKWFYYFAFWNLKKTSWKFTLILAYFVLDSSEWRENEIFLNIKKFWKKIGKKDESAFLIFFCSIYRTRQIFVEGEWWGLFV